MVLQYLPMVTIMLLMAENILSDFFDKKGRLKGNRVIWKPYAEQRINSIYKTLLGLGNTKDTNNDW